MIYTCTDAVRNEKILSKYSFGGVVRKNKKRFIQSHGKTVAVKMACGYPGCPRLTFLISSKKKNSAVPE